MRGLDVGGNGRITRGEECNLVAAADQFIRQVRDHAFCATVELRRNAFIQGSHLRNAEAAAIVVQHFLKSYIWFFTILVLSLLGFA